MKWCDRDVRWMKRIALWLLVSLLPVSVNGEAVRQDDYHWRGIERIVAVGDLHGDYDQYLKVMRSAGLMDKRGRWAGGHTHLVQTGDVTDRGPDSRKIIKSLQKLARSARKKGGYVHLLIGNHEAMDMTGDLRYVSAADFKSYTSRNSRRLQELQWQHQVEWMRSNDSKAFADLDLDAYHEQWLKRVPLGWVEFRQAWSPGGEYGKWVLGHQVAIRINDTLFVHGGISAKYCKDSLQSLTEQVIEALQNYKPGVGSIVDDERGPLWYRGLALEKENETNTETLENILKRYGVKRIVVGHTPTGGVVWPRFGGRVIVNDPGISAYYGANTAALELTAAGAVAIYGDQRVPIPAGNAGRESYLEAVIALRPDNALLQKRLEHMRAPPAAEEPQEDGSEQLPAAQDAAPAAAPAPQPIPGICR